MLRHIWRREGLAADIERASEHMETLTQGNDRLTLNVCFNYGGRTEIVDAVRAIVAAGGPCDEISEELIERHLYTRGLPDPDLVIRTAGGIRVGQFFNLHVAFPQAFVTPVILPAIG